jgi:hypothetical protein
MVSAATLPSRNALSVAFVGGAFLACTILSAGVGIEQGRRSLQRAARDDSPVSWTCLLSAVLQRVFALFDASTATPLIALRVRYNSVEEGVERASFFRAQVHIRYAPKLPIDRLDGRRELSLDPTRDEI